MIRDLQRMFRVSLAIVISQIAAIAPKFWRNFSVIKIGDYLNGRYTLDLYGTDYRRWVERATLANSNF